MKEKQLKIRKIKVFIVGLIMGLILGFIFFSKLSTL